MAAPTFVAASSNSNAGSTTVSVAAPAGVQSGDFQVVAVIAGTSGESFTSTPAGWTVLVDFAATASSTGTYLVRVLYSTTATGAFSMSKSGSRAWTAVRSAYRTHDGYVAGSISSQLNSASGTQPMPSKTPAQAESLVISGIFADTWDVGQGAVTGVPSGFTQRVNLQQTDEWLSAVIADRATTANSQTLSGNFTQGSSAQSTTWSLILAPFGLVNIDAGGDTGTGADTATVDKTDWQNLTDAGTAADDVTVFADQDPLGDIGTGDDVIAVEQLTPIGPVADSGTGDDTVAVANFVGNDLTDAGTGDDTLEVVRTTYVDLTDAGTGDDAHDLLQQLNTVTDAGTGTELLEGLGTPEMSDAGTSDDAIYVRDIPYTQVLPPRPTNIYDLVVVARIPQPSGPPTFVEVDPIEWRAIEYTNTLNKPQNLQASCQIASLTEPVLQRLRSLHTLATELWLYRNGRIVFAGPLQGWQTQGETLTLRARGLQHYLRMMVVDSDKRFEQADQFAMVKWMVDQWQALEYGNFGIDTSGVTTSGVLRDGTYLRSELHNVGQRVEDLGARRDGFDLDVDPSTRRLQLYYPLKGTDRSTGEDSIVLDTRNITSSDMLCSVAPEDLASEAYGSGSEVGQDQALLSVQSNPNLRAVYGRTAVTASWYDVSQQATLDAHTAGLLDIRDTALILPGPRVRVTPDADLDSYGVGDTVTYDLLEPLGVSAAFRIHEQRVVVAPTGDESVDLEFV